MNKPWTESVGPIKATERDVQKAAAINMLLVRPIDVLPAKAGDPIRPFALGLFNDMRALLKPETPLTSLRRAMAAYAHSKRYYFASAQPGSMRHDLSGEPIEPLSEEDRSAAQQRFLELKRTPVTTDQAAVAPPPVTPPEVVPTKNELIRAALLKRRKEAI